MSDKQYIPCGGCGATDPINRCLGCRHPFELEDKPEGKEANPIHKAWTVNSEIINGRHLMTPQGFWNAVQALHPSESAGVKMIIANPAQLTNFLWNEKNKFPLNAIKGSVAKGFEVDVTELFPWLMKFQQWLSDFNDAESKNESPTAAGDGKEDAMAFIAAVTEEGAEMWKMEYDSCRKILEELVDLKDIKDREGKTDDYLMRQPVAWVRAKRFLEKYQHINW